MPLAQLNINGFKLDLVESDLKEVIEGYPDVPEMAEIYDYLIRNSNYPPLIRVILEKDFVKPETAQYVIERYLHNSLVMINVINSNAVASLITREQIIEAMSLSDCVVLVVASSLSAYKEVDQLALAQWIVDHGSVSAVLNLIKENELPEPIIVQLKNHANNLIAWQMQFAESDPNRGHFYSETTRC